jgi:arylsulfatase A-like enzyme
MYYEGDPKGRYVPVAVPGHTPPASVMNAPGLIDPSIHLADGQEDHLATKLALSAIGKMQPRMLLINYPEFDWPLGHVYGGNLNSGKVITDMRTFDADLGKIEDAYRAAGILNQTLFVITADHGMMPITRFIPSSIVSNAIVKAGTTSPDTASSTADYVWLADTSKAQAVAENIVAAKDPGIASVYYLSTANGKPQYVAASGNSSAGMNAADAYLLSGMLNGHEPAVVAFGTEGTTFSDPTTNWKADHGGDTWQSQHVPLIMAGPGIKSGVVNDGPVQLEDVAPTALSAMGVTPTGMTGSPITEILAQPSPAAQKARAAEKTQVEPVLQGLTAQG